jgi:hypothetical protein
MKDEEFWKIYIDLTNKFDKATNDKFRQQYYNELTNFLHKRDVNDLMKTPSCSILSSLDKNKPDTAIAILKAIGNVNYQDSAGNTAAHQAAMSKNIKLLEKLNTNQANLNIRNKEGDTILHLIAKSPTPETTEFILKNYNLDHSIINNENELPLVVAIKKYEELIEKYNPNDKNKNFIDSTLKQYERLLPFLEHSLNNSFSAPYPSFETGTPWVIPDLIKCFSNTLNGEQRAEFNKVIDTAWGVAEEAAKKGDISLKANLAYLASKCAASMDWSTTPYIIKAYKGNYTPFLNSDNYGNKRGDLSQGSFIKDLDTINVSFDLESLPNSVQLLMHEILHSTITDVFENNAKPSHNVNNNADKNSGIVDTRAQAQLADFTKDLKSLAEFSNENNSNRELTQNVFSSIVHDVYQSNDGKGNRTVNVNNPEYKEVTFNQRTARKEMYTYLMSLKTEEYTKEFIEKGKITKDSSAVAYAPNINSAFQQDFTRYILPDLERRIQDLGKKGIKLAGIETFKAEIQNHYELSKQGKPKRISNSEAQSNSFAQQVQRVTHKPISKPEIKTKVADTIKPVIHNKTEPQKQSKPNIIQAARSQSKSWTHHVGKDAPKTSNKPLTPATPASATKVSALKNKFEELAKKESHVERIKGKIQSEDKNRNK